MAGRSEVPTRFPPTIAYSSLGLFIKLHPALPLRLTLCLSSTFKPARNPPAHIFWARVLHKSLQRARKKVSCEPPKLDRRDKLFMRVRLAHLTLEGRLPDIFSTNE